MKKFLKENWALLAILAVAAFFRFWQIADFPGGLFPDEAANGLDVNSILAGDLQPFYERGNGREALFFYLLAVPVWLFGPGVWQHHVVSAALGFFTVLAAYFLTKRLFNKNTALLAAFFMAVSSYAVTLSRTAFRANTAPLMATLTLLFVVRYFQVREKKQKVWSAILAGACFGLGFYTYISFRMIPVLLFGFLIVAVFASRGRLTQIFRKHWKYLLTFAASFAAAAFWIFYYFITHPGTFVGRAGQVSIFSPDLNQGDPAGTFLAVVKTTILAFFTQGDLNWRHNVAGAPFLSPFESPFFAAAIVIFLIAALVAVKQAWEKKIEPANFHKLIVISLFTLMLVPEITTAEGIPHGLRLIGIIPALYILPAFAVNLFWRKIRSGAKTLFEKDLLRAAAVFFLAAVLFYNLNLYFAVAANSRGYYYAFRSDLTSVSEYLNERNNREQTYLSLDAFSVQTVEYLTSGAGQPYQLIIPEKTFEVDMQPGDQVVFTQSTIFDRTKFVQHHPRAELIKSDVNKFGDVIMLVYEQP